MPVFQGTDLLLLLALGGFIIWELAGLLSCRGKIKLPGKVFGRIISMILFMILVFVAAMRSQGDPTVRLIIFGGILLSGVLSLLLKAGLGDNGLYFNGSFIPYVKMKYYNIERENEKTFSFRMDAGRRDYVLEFPADQRELAIAYMIKGKVPDFQAYKEQQAQGRR